MIQIPDITLCSPEAVGLVADDLRFVVQALHGAVVDGHPEIVHQIILMAPEHPGKLPHGLEA